MPTPLSNIKLLANVDIKNDYKNTFTFPTVTDQVSFFSSKAVRTKENVTYIRQDNVFRYDGVVDEIYNINYIMYQNADFNNKWFFAFVTDVKYKNEKTTFIEFEIDVLQTWKFEIDYKNCMIEREHVADDTIGSNLIEENLNIGEVVIKQSVDTEGIRDLIYIFVASGFPDLPSDAIAGNIYSGVYQGLWYFGTDNITQLNSWLFYFNDEGQIDELVTIFTMPKDLVDTYADGRIFGSSFGKSLTTSITKNYSNLDGYVPKNNKMFIHPYNYLEVINNQGQAGIFRYEDFFSSDCGFIMTANVAPSTVVFLEPQEYKNQFIDTGEYLTLSDYPLSSWKGDTYATWLAQNQVSNALKIGGGAVAIGVGAFTGNLLAVGGGLATLASSIGEFKQQSIRPDTARGSASGGGNVARSKQVFSLMQKTIKSEFARQLDDFFSMYGYKVNKLATPNFETRGNWNYLKLIEANLFGDINNKDMVKIRQIFESGLTFWHTDNVGNYSLPNTASIGGGVPDPPPVIEPDPDGSNSLGFLFPLEVDYTFTSAYGYRVHPITGDVTFHYGIDLACASQSPVLSTLDNGVVTANGFDSELGNYVFIDYPLDGYVYTVINQHLYEPTHLLFGDTVNKGDLVGLVGTTGSSTGNHLHFGLKEDDVYVDPWLYINPTI